jgi:VanZ family protein
MNTKLIRGGCIAAAFFMAATLFLAADKAGQIPLLPYIPDKVLHFCYFAVMALLFAHGVGRSWWGIALLLVPIIGALDEWHQFYVPGRDSSVWDWAADLIGAGVAVYLYKRWALRGNAHHQDTKTRRNTKKQS